MSIIAAGSVTWVAFITMLMNVYHATLQTAISVFIEARATKHQMPCVCPARKRVLVLNTLLLD
jgi:hypothetical protein